MLWSPPKDALDSMEVIWLNLGEKLFLILTMINLASDKQLVWALVYLAQDFKLLWVSFYWFSASSTIGNYNPLLDWGYNYFITAQRDGNSNTVIFELVIRSDNSWSSIQLGYLFNSRSDIAVGNFEVGTFLYNIRC